jgi:uncharacterized coiled-coil protein SlyX
MTNSEESRLDRAERLILGLAEQSDIIQQQVNLTSNAIAQTQRQVDLNSRALGQLIQTAQDMITTQQQEAQTFTQSITEVRDAITSINAAVERFYALMDYLMRRDGDRPSQQ